MAASTSLCTICQAYLKQLAAYELGTRDLSPFSENTTCLISDHNSDSLFHFGISYCIIWATATELTKLVRQYQAVSKKYRYLDCRFLAYPQFDSQEFNQRGIMIEFLVTFTILWKEALKFLNLANWSQLYNWKKPLQHLNFYEFSYTSLTD